MAVRSTRRRSLSGALLALACAPWPALRTAWAHDGHDHKPKASSDAVTAPVRTLADVATPDITLMRETGQAGRLADSLATAEPVLLNFIFTSCTTVCPVQTQVFAQVQERLRETGRAARLVSVSIDPLHDTPQKLAAYARQFGAGSQWHFLTGTPQASAAVQRAFGTWRGDKMNHPLVSFVRPGGSRRWVRLDGPASAHDLLRELQTPTT